MKKTEMSVKNDYVFKSIFGKKGNEEILKGLLEAILNVEIKEVEIVENTKLQKEIIKDKLGILDIRVKLADKTKINIEMQVIDTKEMEERTLFYWSKLYVMEIEKGTSYKEIPKTITINILDYNFLPENEYCLAAHIYYDKYKEIKLTDKLEIYFIDLVKFRKKVKKINSKLEAWLSFIDREKKELLPMARNYEKTIRKAEKVLKDLEKDPETLEIYELRQKAIMDEASRKKTYKRIFFEQGKEEGKQEGLKEGENKGKQEGLREGENKGKLEVARHMLEKGLEIDLIKEITGLKEEEVKKIHIK